MRKNLRGRELPVPISMKSKKIFPASEFHPITDARAIDGDAIECLIGLPYLIFVQRRIRLVGFYAPEINGRQPAAAGACKILLQAYLDGHSCWIRSVGGRQDKYGRVIGQLWTVDGPVDGRAVLGTRQMTPAEHKADLAWAAMQRASAVHVAKQPYQRAKRHLSAENEASNECPRDFSYRTAM